MRTLVVILGNHHISTHTKLLLLKQPIKAMMLFYLHQLQVESHCKLQTYDFKHPLPLLQFATFFFFSVFLCCTLESIFENHHHSAFFLFPTKALSQVSLSSNNLHFSFQDQLRSLRSFLDPLPPCSKCALCSASGSECPLVLPATFDGDTSLDLRKSACEKANVLLINPDILHFTILPKWRSFSRILSNLRYIVIDEAHVYRGNFEIFNLLLKASLDKVLLGLMWRGYCADCFGFARSCSAADPK